MKMYLPFGDWSEDGHKQYKKILIDAPSMEHLLEAQYKIKDWYGNSFFALFGEDNSCLGKAVWDALIITKYPVERLIELEDNNDWNGINSINQLLEIDPNPYVGLDFVIDAFIWLLNAYGAQIIRLDDIPMICNWTCPGFETVGYGCLDY